MVIVATLRAATIALVSISGRRDRDQLRAEALFAKGRQREQRPDMVRHQGFVFCIFVSRSKYLGSRVGRSVADSHFRPHPEQRASASHWYV